MISLQGERNFSRKSVMSSSDNYDRHLLSKIGKPNSPPRSSNSDRRVSGSIATLPHPGTLAGSYQPSSACDSSFNLGAYTASSGGVSPRSKPAWTGYRSPSVESSAPSTGIDHDTYSSRRRPGTTTPQSEDTFSFHNRYHRTSQEQNVFPEPEGEDDSDQFRHILDDRTPNGPDSMSRHHGMKRRASSPPREPVSDSRQHTLHKATSNGDLAQRRTSGHPFTNHASPGSRYVPSHGSMSSISSASYRTSTSSFGSSVGLSVGGSSMTSTSSYDRISSGGLSPQSDGDHFYEKQQGAGGSLNSIQAPRAPYNNSADAKPILPSRKLSMQSTMTNSKGIKLVGLYICDCCPKKPKRFDTEAELRYVLVLSNSDTEANTILRLGRTSQRSNTRASIATIDSRTRTRQSDTKTPFICDAIHGHARHFLVSRQLSTTQLRLQPRVI
jgi:hypothetical protein